MTPEALAEEIEEAEVVGEVTLPEGKPDDLYGITVCETDGSAYANRRDGLYLVTGKTMTRIEVEGEAPEGLMVYAVMNSADGKLLHTSHGVYWVEGTQMGKVDVK